MRRIVALPLALVAVITLHSTPVGAQDKTARGTVTAMAGDSLTIKAADGDMKFSVDASTKVVARGAGTQAGRAAAAGQSGPTLNSVVKVGQAVEVTYSGTGGAMHASEIRAVPSASGGGASAGAAKTQTASGTVSSVSLTSITIGGGAGGGAKFTRTFAIDTSTNVVARGAGTTAAAAGGRTPITELVANGDRVSISYTASGGMNHASEIRVTGKKAAPKK
jgi:uncharacterized protein DUF5666